MLRILGALVIVGSCVGFGAAEKPEAEFELSDARNDTARLM